MAELDLRCRCTKWPRHCENRMSQEDMRCDICRDKCGFVSSGTWSAHYSKAEAFIAPFTGTFEIRV